MRRRSFLLAERGSPAIPAPATGSPDPARAAASASSGFGRLGDGGRGPEPGSPGTSAVQTSTKFPCPPRTRDRGPRSPEFPCLPQPSGRIPLRSQGRKPTRPSVRVRAAPARWRGTGKKTPGNGRGQRGGWGGRGAAAARRLHRSGPPKAQGVGGRGRRLGPVAAGGGSAGGRWGSPGSPAQRLPAAAPRWPLVGELRLDAARDRERAVGHWTIPLRVR